MGNRQQKEPITLTREDWEEVYYALRSKREAIREGAYGPEDRPGEDEKWATRLNVLMKRIGTDGLKAAERGVVPAI
jgi:hypothetical protein